MKLINKFEREFGTIEAAKIFRAAVGHRPHQIRGDDEFGWAILIVIGFDCIKIKEYAEYHDIKISYRDFRKFCIENKKQIISNNGECDILSIFTGDYSFLIN